MTGSDPGPLGFEIVGQRVGIRVADGDLRRLVLANLAAHLRPNDTERAAAQLCYRIERMPGGPGYDGQTAQGAQAGQDIWFVDSQGDGRVAARRDLLVLLEADLVTALQIRRPDLLFLHSAVLAWKGGACMVAGESGAGKSTLSWALLHHGFGYASDELAAVDPAGLVVHPYAHAPCLKASPGAPYEMPTQTLRLGRRMHVPCASLPAAVVDEPLPVHTLILLEPRDPSAEPRLRVLEPAEAAARLYVHVLNALAHPARGLDPVVRLVENVRCYALAAAGLPETCAAIVRELS